MVFPKPLAEDRHEFQRKADDVRTLKFLILSPYCVNDVLASQRDLLSSAFS